MTAYEELKAWCEKHLNTDCYKVVPESRSFCTTIYVKNCVEGLCMVCFMPDGSVAGFDAIDEDDMMEHIEDYERTEEAPEPDLVPTPIAGQMVRKMIEAYERNMNK